MLRSLFVDFNSYFASVEQQVRPALRGRPVGVLPVLAETSCCIAASYEAKAFGVKTGTGVREARAMCPGIVLVEARHALYVEFHHRAVAAVERIAPVRQVLSIDEMECELTGSWRQRERALKIAHDIKHELQTTVGECLRSSVGIAPNTLLAKLASNMQKPDGLTVIELADLPTLLLPLKLQAINGIGPRMARRLERCGITTMAELWAAPRDLLRTAWGGVAGADMYDKLRGQWQAPMATGAAPRSIGHSHVLPPYLRTPAGALPVLHRLMIKAAMRLRKQGFYATALVLHMRSEHRFRHAGEPHGMTRDTRFGQTQDTAFLLHTLNTLWYSGLHQLAHPLSVGLVLHGLVPVALHTPGLFDNLTAAATYDEQLHTTAAPLVNHAPVRERSRLHAAMDAINRNHGKNALYFASAHTALDHAPMRIAFTRIPDVETER